MLLNIKVLQLLPLAITRELSQEFLNLGLGGLENLGVTGHIQNHTIAALGLIQNCVPDALEAGKKRRPVLLGLLQQILDGLKVRDAAHLLADVSADGVAALDPGVGVGVSASLDAALDTGLGFLEHLNNSALGIELRIGKDKLEERKELTGLVAGGLSLNHNLSYHVVAIGNDALLSTLWLHAAGHECSTDASRVGSNTPGKSHRVHIASSSLHHHTSEERHDSGILQGQRRDVHTEVDICNAGGRNKLMANNLDASVVFVLCDIERVFGNLALEIGELKAGNCSASLRRILRRLQLLEFGSFLDDLIELIVIEGLLDSSETILFLL
mmetsp:Transcript_18643/g.44179  ORF Transcript_18643/g.44179 Transcript_18643/m.44179 type:complete len:327 (+) Transcript_18643:781-1761(+)